MCFWCTRGIPADFLHKSVRKDSLGSNKYQSRLIWVQYLLIVFDL